jgi:rhamnogalacturonan endolyase
MNYSINRIACIFVLSFLTFASKAQEQDIRKTTEENDRKEREFFQKLMRPQYDGDVRERYYYYENLTPAHEKKEKVTGWAANRVEEGLNRGLVAVLNEKGEHFVSWRLLKTDSPDVAFNLYRSEGGKKTLKLNDTPIKQTTNFIDKKVKSGISYNYWVKPVVAGKELESSEIYSFDKSSIEKGLYRSIKFQGNYIPQRVAVADLNGDKLMDFIIKQPEQGIDPGGKTGNTDGLTYKLEAYLNDGTFLWRKDLGLGLEPGIWYTPYIVYDFDGDGKAEVAVKTGPTDVRGVDGRVTTGPEWCSILDGMTGEEKVRFDWPKRDPRFGGYNRQSRNQLGMAFLDGKTPCLIVERGTYKLMVVDAYTFNKGELKKLWHWDGDEESPVIRSQGSHSLHPADVDGDGRDEIVLGSVVLDDDGTALWSTGLGHPDVTMVTDIDPTRPGLEIFYSLEQSRDNGRGVCLVDAKTGKPIWTIGIPTTHVGEGLVADIDPTIPGLECFAQESPKADPGGAGYSQRPPIYMLSAGGKTMEAPANFPGFNNWVFWDADLLREVAVNEARSDANNMPPRPPAQANASAAPGTATPATPPAQRRVRPPANYSVIKYSGQKLTTDIKGDVSFVADIAGDWREEIITVLPGELRIYTTTIPAKDRRVCLLQDPIYRAEIVVQSMGYQQPPVTSYYLGEKP